MQLVVPSAVRNAVSAATNTFTASSIIRCFFITINCQLSTVRSTRRGACYQRDARTSLAIALLVGLGSQHIAQRRLLLESLLLASDGALLTLHEIPKGEHTLVLQRP